MTEEERARQNAEDRQDAEPTQEPQGVSPSPDAEAAAPLTPEVAPDEEAEVYCPRCGAGMQADQRYCTACGWDAEKPDEAPPKHRVPPQSPRQLGPPSNANRLTALLLAFFVGWLGAHRFYVNRPLSGLVWLITLGFLGIGVIYDLVLIATGEFRDGEERRLVYWQ